MKNLLVAFCLILLIPFHSLARTTLTGNLSVYVATTGSDSNDCLSAATPCRNITTAINIAQHNYDCGPYNMTVQVANGTYTENVLQSNPACNGATIYLHGDCTTPSNVIINSPNGNAAVYISKSSNVGMCGFKLTSTGGGNLLYVAEASVMHIDSKMEYGATTACQLYVDYGALIFVAGDSIISGDAGAHYCGLNTGTMIDTGHTITISGNRTFGQFANFQAGSQGGLYGNSFPGGTVSGARYAVWSNAAINLAGNVNALPGSSAGSTGAGGQVY